MEAGCLNFGVVSVHNTLENQPIEPYASISNTNIMSLEKYQERWIVQKRYLETLAVKSREIHIRPHRRLTLAQPVI